MASGLSMPLGFKNGTDGSIQTAVNAIKAAGQAQTFLGINLHGAASAIVTRGNPNCHVVLRGGSNGPNYSPAHVAETERLLEKAGVRPSIMVDCSHGNSAKQPSRQAEVIRSVLTQITTGTTSLIGAMVESNLMAGSQTFPPRSRASGRGKVLAKLRYGVSITDPCMGWAATESLVREIHATLAPRFR
jgi:3-deoxy-7-phosphoheptulonate synthase